MSRRLVPRSWSLPAERLVVIASTPRTGSNLVCTGLGATGVVPVPAEWLNPGDFHHWCDTHGRRAPRPVLHRRAVRRLGRAIGVESFASLSRHSPRQVLRYVRSRAGTELAPDGTLVLKAMWLHYDELLLATGLDLNSLGVPVVWMRTRRVDRVQQAVSLARARATHQWTAGHAARGRVEYDPDEIDRGLRSIDEWELGWDAYFVERGITPHTVVYEDLDARYEEVMAGVLRHCGIDAPVPPRQIERQRDGLSAEWVERYRSDRGLDRN